MKHIVIIGNGIAGITAARHIRKLSDYRITVISAETDHFFSRTALMYIYMGHMKYEHTKPYEDHFWAKNRIELLSGLVEKIDVDHKCLYLSPKGEDSTPLSHRRGGGEVHYDTLILATGSKSNKFGWPGQDLSGVQGLYSYQDLESMETYTKGISRAVVVGGGLIGIEMVEMLLSRYIPVTFLVRENSFWNNILPTGESAMINRHIREHHVDLRLEAELQEITDDGTGRVKSIKIKSGEEIPCQFVGITVGVSPNLSPLSPGGGIEVNRGILVNEFLETNIPDVYAIGDCTELKNPAPGQRALNQIWYTGRIMGETVAQTICGKPTVYQPGVFFNSAKFFDIEYQTYGNVPAQLPAGISTFWWEDQTGKIGIRLNYQTDNQAITGVNGFGLRLRHESFGRWIKEAVTVEYVLEHLPEANFDPEFYKEYEPEILNKFNAENGTNLKVKAKRGIFSNLFS